MFLQRSNDTYGYGIRVTNDIGNENPFDVSERMEKLSLIEWKTNEQLKKNVHAYGSV